MSEQWTPTTDQVRSFYAHDSEDEYRDPIAYPSHVRSAEQAFDRWLAQVQREAAVKALREAADNMDARTNKNELIARADRWEGYYSGVLSSIMKESSALRARADRMETEKLLLD